MRIFATVFVLLISTVIGDESGQPQRKIDDETFWQRFIKESPSMSLKVVTENPSPVPSFLPTQAPTATTITAEGDAVSFNDEGCDLFVNVECILGDTNSQTDGKYCEEDVEIEPCLFRPTSASMLFNGGTCAQSNNDQGALFLCEDVNGGPPTEEGSESYIVVTDAKGKGIVYFEGFVSVGSVYDLNDNGVLFDADQMIMVYSSDDATSENMLQFAQYHSSCSNNLELKSRFGSSQLVAYFNDLQGRVSCFATMDYTIDVSIPLAFSGAGATITKLTAETNFAGIIDLTSQVIGRDMQAGESLTVTLQGEIDISTRKRYTMLIDITGRKSDGTECSGLEFVELSIGIETATEAMSGLPSTTPTSAPTSML